MSRSRASVLIALAALLAMFWLAPSFPLVVFVAVLIGTAIRALATPLHERLGLPEMASVILVAVGLIVLLALGVWLSIGPLTAQALQLRDALPGSIAGLEARLETNGWGRWLLEQGDGGWLSGLNSSELLSNGGRVAGVAATAAGGVFGGLGNAVFTLLLALYFALQPGTYQSGLRHLLAPELQDEVEALFAELGTTLRYWLAGQLFSMLFIGCFVFAGLWLLGVPLAGLLAVLSALLGFVPIVGPIVAAVPAVLLGATQGLDVAAYVVAMYLVLHVIEGDILTPMIQSHAVDLPPALLLMSQLFLGAVFGLLGLAVAAPLAAVMLVVVRRGYVRDWLRGGAPAPVIPAPVFPPPPPVGKPLPQALPTTPAG